MFILFMLDPFLSNSHTTICKKLFIVDPSYMQNIKQLRDEFLSVGCMTCLYFYLYNRFEMLRDGLPSVGCTCPKSCYLKEVNK
jgi:hypothetical protein